MRLNRLRLRDFRQYRTADIQFRDGMTAIMGPNGSGKSTLLEAITYAVYGEHRAKKESIPNLRLAGEMKIDCLVELEFEQAGRHLKVERTIKGKNHTTNAAVLEFKDGEWKTVAQGTTDTNRFLLRLMRLNHQQFTSAFCAMQKELTFLKMDKDKRQREVAKMMGFHLLEDAGNRAKELAKGAKTSRTAIEQTLGNRAAIEEDLRGAHAQVTAAESLLTSMEAEFVALQARAAAAEESKGKAEEWLRHDVRLAELREKGKEIQRAIEGARGAVDLAGKEVARREALAPVDQAWKSLSAQLTEQESKQRQATQHAGLQGQVEALQREVGELEAKLKSLVRPNLAEIEAKVNAAMQAVTATEQRMVALTKTHSDAVNEARTAVQVATSAAASAKANLAKAEKSAALGICPECGQETSGGQFEEILATRRKAVEDAEKTLEDARSAEVSASQPPKELTEAQAELEVAKGAYSALQTEFETCRAQSQAVQREEERLAERRTLWEKRTSELHAAKVDYDPKRHEELKAEQRKLEPDHQEFLALASAPQRLTLAQEDLKNREADFAAMKAENDAVKQKQSDLGVKDRADADAKVQAWNQLRTEVATKETALDGHRRLIEAHRKAAEAAQKRLEEFARNQALHQKHQKDELVFGTVDKEMKALRDALNQGLIPALEERASANLAVLTNNRYTVLELSENFEPSIEDDGHTKSVISGGEEDVVALSLRLALSELIQERHGWPRSLLILDEVFGSLDKDRRDAVQERLQGLRNRFAQVLVISHIEGIEREADQCLYVSIGEDMCSTVTDVHPHELDVPGLETASA